MSKLYRKTRKNRIIFYLLLTFVILCILIYTHLTGSILNDSFNSYHFQRGINGKSNTRLSDSINRRAFNFCRKGLYHGSKADRKKYGTFGKSRGAVQYTYRKFKTIWKFNFIFGSATRGGCENFREEYLNGKTKYLSLVTTTARSFSNCTTRKYGPGSLFTKRQFINEQFNGKSNNLQGYCFNNSGKFCFQSHNEFRYQGEYGTMKSQLLRGQYQLNDLEVKKLISTAFTPRDRLIIMLMSGAGLRRSEVLYLRSSDIVPDPALNITGKGNKRRYVPIKRDLYQEIKFFVGKRQGLVFPSRFNLHRPLTPCVINTMLADVGRKARIINPDPSLKNINCHILRHTYARNLKAAGLSMEAVKNIMGHGSIKTTMDVYGLMSKNDIQKEFNQKMLC